jgi:hypothetical protein
MRNFRTNLSDKYRPFSLWVSINKFRKSIVELSCFSIFFVSKRVVSETILLVVFLFGWYRNALFFFIFFVWEIVNPNCRFSAII